MAIYGYVYRPCDHLVMGALYVSALKTLDIRSILYFWYKKNIKKM